MASQQQQLVTCPFTKPPDDQKLDQLVMRQGRKAMRCSACRARQARSTRCNATAVHGCIECSKFGLPCVVDNWALPPHPGRWAGPTSHMTWTCCSSCITIHSCDRAQPCQSCIARNNEANCSRDFPKGLYNGRVPGDDMYGYYITLGPGRGPNGPRDLDEAGQYAEFRQGDNYHVEYAYDVYRRNGWLQSYWHGPPAVSFPGAPEIPVSQGPIYVGPPLNHRVDHSVVNNSLSAPAAPWTGVESVSTPLPASGSAAAPWAAGHSVLAPPPYFATVEAPMAANASVLATPPAWNPEFSSTSGPDSQANPPAEADPFDFASRLEQSQQDPYNNDVNFQAPLTPESQSFADVGQGVECGTEPRFELGTSMQHPPTAEPPSDSFDEIYLDRLLAASANYDKDVFDHMDIDETGDAEGSSKLPPGHASPWHTWVDWAGPSSQTAEPSSSTQDLPGRSVTVPVITVNPSDTFPAQTSPAESALIDAALDQILADQLPSINHIPIDPRLINDSPVPGQSSSIKGKEHYGSVNPSFSSGTMSLPPLLPLPPPKPVGSSPLSPADLIVQNPAVFQQYQRRIESYWSYWVSDMSIIPAGQISQAWITIARDWLNPRGSMISRTPEPVERPSSPGPLLQLFTKNRVGSQLPDHPAHTDTYPQGRRPLALIPKHRTWEEGALAPIAGLCECGQWTHGICESTDHHPARRCFVCSNCDWTGRQNLWALLGQENFDVVNNIRRFACRMCTLFRLTNPSGFYHSGLEIYDSQTTQDAVPRFDARNMTNNAYGNEGIVIRGGVYQVLPVTGCPCFSKLMERRLCNAHRCQGFFDLMQRMYAMANYLQNNFREASGDVCFLCHSAPQQMPSASDSMAEAGKLWACLGCSGIVMGVRSEDLMGMASYTAYPDNLPGRDKPILLPPKDPDAQPLTATNNQDNLGDIYN